MNAIPRPNRFCLLGIGLLMSMLASIAGAQTRAWLDRDRIAAGETVTLNIETDQSATPDYTPLQALFVVSGNSSRRSYVNGVRSSLFAVALRPRREGVLTVPVLAVGSARTQPLALVVAPASAQQPAQASGDVFIQSEADDNDPYVQQAVGWVVRLYSLAPLVSGVLDQPNPEGASMQRVGDDAQYTRVVNGERYNVVERRYQLIPERSGALSIPGASFEGRGAGGFFDDLFGDRGGELRANAAPRTLQVRAIPANAPQPWLPLHDLQLRYVTTPQQLQVGADATVTIEAIADGVTSAQMPELQLPPIDGVQVFADPVKADDSFVNGRPRARLQRRFALVPSRAGTVRLPETRLGWWDVRSGAARWATLAEQSWLATGSAANATSGATASSATGPTAAPVGVAGIGSDGVDAEGALPSRNFWAPLAVLFALLWLGTLVWALQRRAAASTSGRRGLPPRADAPPVMPPAPGLAALRQVLDSGDFGEVADVLCAMARPPATDVDDVSARLDDPAQRAALDALQRARWAGGDGVDARRQLRAAFASGPRWHPTVRVAAEPLAPLYPQRQGR
ncbi:BatD family protein [Montanilutibacter psychrotolerans]|nr:BatD family protein [Lysobacter psychrotolerans]